MEWILGVLFGLGGPQSHDWNKADEPKPAIEELTEDQRKALEDGEMITVAEEVEGSSWPKTWVYKLYDGTAEEGMAVYFDYALAVDYIPDLKKAEIKKWVTPLVAEIDYTVNLPWPIPNEDYTTRDTAVFVEELGGYRVDYKKVRADTVKDIKGYQKFEKYDDDRAVYAGYNYTVPSGALSGLAKNRVVESAQKVCEAVLTQIKKEKEEEDQPKLGEQLDRLRQAFVDAGEN